MNISLQLLEMFIRQAICRLLLYILYFSEFLFIPIPPHKHIGLIALKIVRLSSFAKLQMKLGEIAKFG